MRLLQMHEYLDVLRPRVEKYEPSSDEVDATLRKAREIWPDTGLTAWETHPRPISYSWISADGSRIALHIAADHTDCFVIVLSKRSNLDEASYLVFDIGAQYVGQRYVCPSISFDDEPDPAVIRRSIPRLNLHKDAFAILECNGGTYMQAFQDADGRYELEHQLVTRRNHYRAVGSIGADEVIAAFLSYAFGKYEWARDITWERIDP